MKVLDPSGVCVCQGGGTLIVSYIRRLDHYLGFNILNFNIYLFIYFFLGGGGVQKNEYFLGYAKFVDIIWGHPKFGLILGVISMYFRVFS